MRPLVLDVSRLLTGLRFAGPTGVETLELGLARHLPPGPGLALTPWGARVAAPVARARIANAAARRWREDDNDVAAELAGVAAFLSGTSVPHPAPRRERSLLGALRFAPALLRGAAALPADAVTIHTGFFRLERPEMFVWKAKRPDIGTIIAFHDILPLKQPAWFRPGEAVLHRKRLSTALNLADAITVAASTVRDEISAIAAEAGLTAPPIHVIDLPVSPRFAKATPFIGAEPYMLIAGTIEPRKNHALLLEVWRRLGAAAPKLIIAGRRGWSNDAVFAALDAQPDSVMEAPGLSSSALAALVKGAAAVLSPSLDEGFGLPVAEALSAGTPVIAADTPVYRALWGGHAKLVPVNDAQAWVDAVRTPTKRFAPYVRTDWPSYVSALQAVAGSL
jgi:glycosyltransferase involved in cell wall biosynthesis